MELGKFLRGRRDECVVATKYGIPAALWVEKAIRVSGKFARPTIAIRSLMRRVGLAPDHLPIMTPTGLERSVHASLRRLGIEYIDIHFLHEPSLARIPDVTALIEKYKSLRSEGLIRVFGLAGTYFDCRAILRLACYSNVIVQTAESDWDSSLVPDIVYGLVARGKQSIDSRSGLDAVAVERRIRAALARRDRGVVLISTTRTDHLESIGAAAREPIQER
jgi:aryl-alcohol dehydrogenase-like predicted oxidoreductase